MEADNEFLQLADLLDLGPDLFETAMEHFEDINFDVFHFCQLFTGNDKSMAFMIHKIFQKYELYKKYHIACETLHNWSTEMAAGYFRENKYHNQEHIIDSLQAMHYLLTVGNLQKMLPKLDIYSVFVANVIHDFEHPGYQNQFIVRTKHPIAMRYSDVSVLEQHHLAAAFSVFLKNDECNIMRNLPWDMYRQSRKMIIEIVLNSDFSKHFSLMTTLKTKLGNNLQPD